MKSETIGGLDVRSAGKNDPAGVYLLGHNPYQYQMIIVSEGTSHSLQGSDHYCFYLYSENSPAEVRIGNETLKNGETLVLSQSEPVSVLGTRGRGYLLTGSKLTSYAGRPAGQKFEESRIKRVTKPWGYELWLTGDPSPIFAFKKIFIKAGTKTSLQYHRFKRETNFLVEGEAALHYNPDTRVKAEAFSPADVAIRKLDPFTVIDVFPNHVHRLEALSDILLFEVSTPELDDVVRISDDSGRKDGRITSEHKV